MRIREFYKVNGDDYINANTRSASIYESTNDNISQLRNRIVKKLLNLRMKSERNNVYCSISGKPMELFIDYPIVDGVLVYIKHCPKSTLKCGIDYFTVTVKRVKYYIFPISKEALCYLTHKTVEELEKRVILGRLYSKPAIMKRLSLSKKNKLGDFVLRSKSLYHNGTKLSNKISKYYKLSKGIEDWETPEEVETTPEPAPSKSWWQWW